MPRDEQRFAAEQPGGIALVDRAARSVRQRAAGRELEPGDLRVPTRKLSYDPGYDICVVISSVAMFELAEDGLRVPALAVSHRRCLTAYHNVKRWSIGDDDNLVLRG